MTWDIVFAPLIATTWLWLFASVTILLGVYSLWRRLPGTLFRTSALTILLMILANPTILQEERDPVKDVVAVVVDQTTSQEIGERSSVTEDSLAQLKQTLSGLTDIDVREMTVRSPEEKSRGARQAGEGSAEP